MAPPIGFIPWNKNTIGKMPTPWNKGTKGLMKAWNKGRTDLPPSWNSGIKGVIKANSGTFTKGQMTDDKNPAWKGDAVFYGPLHSWIRKKLGRPNACHQCGNLGEVIGKKHSRWSIEWANITEKYTRDLKNYVPLCVWCHRTFDCARRDNMKLVLNKNLCDSGC
jgi:hypothetical protein